MTAQSEIGALRSVVVHHPRDVFRSQADIAAQWKALNYTAEPDMGRAVEEFDRFVALLREAGAEVVFGAPGKGARLDSVYVRDAAIVTDGGAVLCSMAKAARAGEPEALRDTLQKAGVEVLGAIDGEGTLEGGDVAWLSDNRLAVGRGYRTNDEGIRQLRELTRHLVDELVVVPLPHWRGPAGVFHLMSMFSPVDHDKALVYTPLLPVPFRQWLLDRGQLLIGVADEEFASMACNVLALAPGKCVMLEGNPSTRARLEAGGVEVIEFGGAEICGKGEGGPTCLTRPLWRER